MRLDEHARRQLAGESNLFVSNTTTNTTTTTKKKTAAKAKLLEYLDSDDSDTEIDATATFLGDSTDEEPESSDEESDHDSASDEEDEAAPAADEQPAQQKWEGTQSVFGATISSGAALVDRLREQAAGADGAEPNGEEAAFPACLPWARPFELDGRDGPAAAKLLKLAQLITAVELTQKELSLILKRYSGGDLGVFLERELHDGPGIAAMRTAPSAASVRRQRKRRQKAKGKEEASKAKPRSEEGSDSSSPFDDAEQEFSGGVVHIRVQKRNGRKCITTLTNLQSAPVKSLRKPLSKLLSCATSIAKDAEFGDVLQLQGDKRPELAAFLVERELVQKDKLMVHGF